jgi:hypothetical protein
VSSARFTRTLEDFKRSPEASAPAPVVPYYDERLPASSTTRELQERKDRLARPDDLNTTGREGMVPEGGSIAQTSTRHTAELNQSQPDIRAQQVATVAALRKLGASVAEIKAVAEQLKNLPVAKLLKISTWTSMLEKLRNFRRGTLT